MAIRLPSNLHRARSGILHFRIAIPPDLRTHFKVSEIHRTLRTASVHEAVPTAQALSQAAKRAFQQIRTATMSNPKKTPQDPFDGSDWGLISEVSFDEFMRPTLKMTPQPGDTREDRIQAQVEFLQAAGFAGAGSQAPKKPSPLFSELVEDYKRDRLAAKRWTPKTQDENLAVYKMCIDIIGNLPISEIGEEQALTYLETMQKLPPNMNKMPAYRGKSIIEIIALNPAPMATRTINKSLERISSLFKFATSKPKYDLRYNPFSGRSLDESDGQQREPFTNDELARLFGAAEHAQRQYTTAYSYWLPLMGLLTGARLNELCQLHLSDFEVVGGIDCINIQDAEEGQRLKNKSAKRLVPIHDKLIEIGLIRYVDRLRAQGHDRLFPTLKLTDEGYGKMPSRWFGRFKERCGIMEKHTKVFHSFRHTFISTLLDNDVEETAIAPIVGHDGKLITGQVYWNVKDAVKRKPTVEKFQPHHDVWRLVPKFEDVVITDDPGIADVK
jgi:integrase